jgi:hypothetical protein
MERAQMLREQAAIMRRLAESFDIPAIKAELLELARRCDELAAELAAEISRLPTPKKAPPSA